MNEAKVDRLSNHKLTTHSKMSKIGEMHHAIVAVRVSVFIGGLKILGRDLMAAMGTSHPPSGRFES